MGQWLDNTRPSRTTQSYPCPLLLHRRARSAPALRRQRRQPRAPPRVWCRRRARARAPPHLWCRLRQPRAPPHQRGCSRPPHQHWCPCRGARGDAPPHQRRLRRSRCGAHAPPPHQLGLQSRRLRRRWHCNARRPRQPCWRPELLSPGGRFPFVRQLWRRQLARCWQGARGQAPARVCRGGVKSGVWVATTSGVPGLLQANACPPMPHTRLLSAALPPAARGAGGDGQQAGGWAWEGDDFRDVVGRVGGKAHATRGLHLPPILLLSSLPLCGLPSCCCRMAAHEPPPGCVASHLVSQPCSPAHPGLPPPPPPPSSPLQFVKLLRDAGVLGGRLTVTSADLAFTKAKSMVSRCMKP